MEQISEYIISSFIVAVIGGIGKILSDVYEHSNFKTKSFSKIWKCKVKKGSFSRYCNHLLACILAPFLILILASIIYSLIFTFQIQANSKGITYIIGVILYVVWIALFNIYSIPKKELTNRKKEKVDGKKKYFIWNIPLVDSLFLFILFCFIEKLNFLISPAYFMFLILELCSGFYLENTSMLQFSKLKMVLDDDKFVSNIKSDSLRVNAKWFVGIQCSGKEEKEIRVPQDKVKLIVYYDKQF